MQPTVIVLAMNKRFGIAYKLGQGNVSHWSPKWVPTAEVFGKLHRPQGSQIVARRPNGIQVITTPVWNDDMRITPAFVRRLVEWALSEQER